METSVLVEPCASQIKITSETHDYLHQAVYFQIMFLKDSHFVYVGSAPRPMDQFNVASISKYTKEPITSALWGGNGDGGEYSAGVAARLGNAVVFLFQYM